MGAVQRFVEAEADFEVASEESVLPDDRTHAVATSELALSMTRPEARQVVERWLAEARIARDTLRFALPPSRGDLGPGDLIRLDQPDMAGTYRIDAVEIGPYRIAEAQRIEPAVYRPLDMVDEVPPAFDFVPPIPPLPLFLDLPLLSGQEQEHAPHLAVTAAPWPGAMALYAASGGEDFALVGLYGRPATVGTLVTALPAASPALLDTGAPVQIRLSRGTLQSVSLERLLAGANLAAIGDGSPEGWEVIQFATAELVAPGEFMLSRRVRGRNGSDAEMAPTHPEGSYFVLLDQSVEQIPFASGDRGVQRNYRIGPARRAIDDPTYVAQAHAFRGQGLRPLSPVHLRLTPSSAGHDLTWIRRTRIDGDTWDGFDVPLGEENELYRVRVRNGSTILREAITSEPRWSYTTADRTTDAPPIGAELEVTQISARYGAGASARLSL
ncbi:MAG TPA: hypothetical protein DEF12_12800 [Rhodobacteraceae bacterium]|nr:hypothetical protein [Paracoccaceae bacterium]